MQTPSRTLRLLAAVLPLLALLSDLLAVLQGEAIWRYAAGLALGAGALAGLWDARARAQPRATLLASGCMVASLGVQLLAPGPAEVRLAVGAWLGAGAVALLLISGALLEGVGGPERSLVALLESPADEVAERPGAGEPRRAA